MPGELEELLESVQVKSTLGASSGDTSGECVGESQSRRNQRRRVTKENRKNV